MKTLFCSAPGRVGVLVTSTSKGRQRQRMLRFKDGHEALTWCEKHGAVLVYMPVDASNN